jgi:hypothetical protein
MKGSVLDKIRADFNTDKRDRRVLTEAVTSVWLRIATCLQMRTACLACGHGQSHSLGRIAFKSEGWDFVCI